MRIRYGLEIIVAVVILLFFAAFLYAGMKSPDTVFPGTDTVAAEKIAGPAGGTVQPLVPQWIPPAGMEATLFALQAAAGGFCIGIVFGFWIGQKKTSAGGQ